jgi:hypothetical protein
MNDFNFLSSDINFPVVGQSSSESPEFVLSGFYCQPAAGCEAASVPTKPLVIQISADTVLSTVDPPGSENPARRRQKSCPPREHYVELLVPTESASASTQQSNRLHLHQPTSSKVAKSFFIAEREYLLILERL